jgi:hypothetical protein
MAEIHLLPMNIAAILAHQKEIEENFAQAFGG